VSDSMPLSSAILIAARSTRSLLSGSRGCDPASARVTTAPVPPCAPDRTGCTRPRPPWQPYAV